MFLAHQFFVGAGCWRPNLGQETCHSESKIAYNQCSVFVEVMGHEDRRSLRNSLKLPLGKWRPSLHPMYSSTFFRRQQGLKRFLQSLREGLRDQDHIRHSNETTAVPAIGANNSPSQKFHGILMPRTNSSPTTTTFRPRQRRSSHTTWVSSNPFLGDELT